MVLDIIRGLVSHTALLDLDSMLDVFQISQRHLRDCVVLIKLRQMSTSERGERELRISKVCWLEEPVCAAKGDLETLCVARAKSDKLVSERSLLTARNEKAKAESDTLPTSIRKPKVSVATRDGSYAMWCRLCDF